MSLLDGVFGVHERALKLKSQRLELLSQNIANADTPNFKARDLDFKALLKSTDESAVGLQSTHPSHVNGQAFAQSDNVKYRIPFNTAFDGNTVEMSVEQAQYGQAAGEYQATLNFLESRVSGLRRALKGE